MTHDYWTVNRYKKNNYMSVVLHLQVSIDVMKLAKISPFNFYNKKI